MSIKSVFVRKAIFSTCYLFATVFVSFSALGETIKLPEALPLIMTFRAADNIKFGSEAFNKRLEEMAPYSWIHAPGPDEKMLATRKRWPDKIITLQNAYGGISEDYFSEAWPGHLLYKVGTLLTQSISSEDSVIEVDDVSRIVKKKKLVKKANHEFPFALVIYALDNAGKPDWSHAEHVILDSIKDGKLVVKRGQWQSKPLSFKAKKAVVAAHMMFWSRQWQLNLSLHSPRGGADNLTAQEWFARKVSKRVLDTKADGVEFDVGRWTWGKPAMNSMDVNNDRIADYGYLDGVNSFGLGGQIFFRELRKLIGSDKIIQADSNDAMFGVRGWSYLNGIQQEAFPAVSDFDRFSEIFQHLRLWTENAQMLPRVSYPFSKTSTTLYGNVYLPNGGKTDFHFRVGFASACLVGMPHAFANAVRDDFDPANPKLGAKESGNMFGIFDWDEYHGGNLNDWHWLGKPLGPATQDLSDMDHADLLEKAKWQWTVEKKFAAKTNNVENVFSANVQSIPDGILPDNMWYAVSLAPSGKKLPQLSADREYTLEFDARGDDVWHYMGQDLNKVPRVIAINGAIKSRADKPLSVLVDDQWRTYKISFIADASGATTPKFGVSEQIGSTEIRHIKLHSGGVERWSREFEKGLVLLNMTTNPWTFVLKGKYKRLKGKQDPSINSGAAADGKIIVPARDAVFLIKQ